jgi:hypothetical protein
MRRVSFRRPSPAMAVALLALFIALGGTGYAAVKVNGKNITGRSIPGKAIRKNTLTGSEIRESRLATVPRASKATTATTATNATNAKNASTLAGSAPSAFLAAGATAADSSKLGGIAAAGFVRRECATTTGQIKGVLSVDASAAFPAAFTAVAGYNCSGQTIEARRLSMGRYEVRFNGSPVTQAVATAFVTAFKADMISLTNTAPGVFTVYVLDPLPAPGAFVDDDFTILTP